MSKQQLKFRPSIISNNLAEQVANEEIKSESSDSLKKMYSDLMDQLFIDNIPQNQISIVGQKIIIERKRNILKQKGSTDDELKKVSIGSHWFDIAKTKNMTDSFYARNTKIDPEADQENSSLTEYEKENTEYLKVIKNTKIFLVIAENKLKNNHFMSLLNEQDDKVTIALHDWQSQLDLAESAFDHKEKIPVNTQHILLHAIGTMSSNNDAAEEYFRLREKAQKLTGKQLSKYRSGLIKTSLAIFNPKDRVTAILWKYFGSQCMKCKSWKVIEVSKISDKTKVVCLECENEFKVDSTSKCNFCGFPFFEDELTFIKKANTCPNCKEELPEYLMNHILN